jgi:PAS domain S-box-containing protein
MPDSLIDLDGLRVAAEEFLATVLGSASQPIWVVDEDDVIRFANPAAIAALGYDSADELLGHHCHETIHHSRPDGTPYPVEECPIATPRPGGSVSIDLDWFIRRDGSMFPVSYVVAPIELHGTRASVVAFTDIEERLRVEGELRERNETLTGEHAALRRVATLVARGVPSSEVCAAVAREAGLLLGADATHIARFEPDGTATLIAGWTRSGEPIPLGTTAPTDGENVSAPIVVDGRRWGVAIVSPRADRPPPFDTKSRLAAFTDLVATAISNAAARAEVRRLADEQAALRRVATLVAQGVPTDALFGAVVAEVGRLFDAQLAGMIRYVTGEAVTAVATWAAQGTHPEVTGVWPLEGDRLATRILRTGEPTREDHWEGASGPIAAFVREQLGVRSSVGCPIVVEGRVWGALFVHSTTSQPLPRATESRLADFTELVATAIANAQSRSDLAASRARIVAAADDERRRVVRDLHDGAQQRLVHTVITLKLARRALRPDEEPVFGLVTEALEHTERATAELRELVHGILPRVLTHGGLAAGVAALASRVPVPVEIDVSGDRLPAAVEATAYFVIAEALTNVAKHAGATGAQVLARVADGSLRIEVRDDGAGGARADGPGLVGLADRLAALDGRLRVESPPGRGTLVAAEIPLSEGPR